MVKHLILSGGGIKGICILGALNYVYKKKLVKMTQLKSIAGSSVGALIGVMLCLGYTPYQLYYEYKHLDVSTILDPDISNLIEYYGLDTGYKFVSYIQKMFKGRGHSENITFKELYEKTGIHLILTGTNVNLRVTEYFDYTNTPNTKVIDGMRVSFSFPFYFTSPKFKDCYYVDGGLLDNFPVHLFHNASPSDVMAIKLKKIRDHQTPPIPRKINNLESYVHALINCFLEEIEYLKSTTNKDTYLNSTMFIEENEVAIMDLNLSHERLEYLYQTGFETAKKYTHSKEYFTLRLNTLNERLMNVVNNFVTK